MIRRLTAGAWVLDDFRARAVKAVDEARRLVYFTATQKSPTERHLYVTSLDTRTPQVVHRVTKQDGVHGISMAPDGGFYVDSFSSTTQPTQVGLYKPNGDLIDYLSENRLDENHPYASYLAGDSAPEFGELRASDGSTLHYRLLKPADFDPGKHYPVIVDVYGGPGAQRVLKNWDGANFAQLMARAGYVVFQLDNRGSASRGEKFQSPIKGRLGVVEVEDQILGARWLAQQSCVDPRRIGVWGWSYGGYMTLMLMFKAPELFQVGVAGAPVTDWALYDTHYTERYLNRPQDNREGYTASSVFPFAPGLRGKLLIMHGMADDNVLFLNSTKLFRTLQNLGKPFDIMAYPGGKHGLTRTADGRHAYSMIKRFFDDNLRDMHVDATP